MGTLHAVHPLIDRGDASFYRAVLQTLRGHDVPFLLGGTFALCHHARFARHTKDLDVFVRKSDLLLALETLAGAGFRVELPYQHWLAKAYKGELFVDVIFSSGNGVAAVDEEWFAHASSGTALGVPVQICPAEETLWSKAYIMERERYDGADVAHLIRACGERLDWPRVVRRFGAHWRVLLSHLVLYGFIYPKERDKVPRRVLDDLLARLRTDETNDDACHGTLLSREQFLVDVEQWGYADSRLVEHTMDEAQITAWTLPIRTRH